MSVKHLLLDTFFWPQRLYVEEAERKYYEKLSGAGGEVAGQCASNTAQQSTLQQEIARAREQIQKSMEDGSNAAGAAGGVDSAVEKQIQQLKDENKQLRDVTSSLQQMVKKLEQRVTDLEKGTAPVASKPAPPATKQAVEDDDDDDDDFELFGSDEEEESAEALRLKEERLKNYHEKKSKKPAVVAKSNVILDVKPWDDETDMKQLENAVRSIEMPGLLWGAGKLVPLAYGIKKLQISCVVEDDKVSTEELEEKITDFEDLIQSVDIAAFNKI